MSKETLGRDTSEYGEAVLAIDGTWYGDAVNDSLVHQAGNGNGGDVYDTGWQEATFLIELEAGIHTLSLGAYCNLATYTDEWTAVWFDDLILSPLPG